MPRLLVAPSAWSALSRGRARVLLILLALLVIAAASLPHAPTGDDDRRSFALDTGVVEGVRAGGDYYRVAADLVRGDEGPARPLIGVRLPTLAEIAGAVPPRVASALLATLALAVALAWYERLAPALSRPAARIGAGVLLIAGIGASLRPDAALAPEAWAGLFVALSLARWRPGRAVEATGWALTAALVDERAALALVIMALFACTDRARREAAGWAVALIVFAVVVAVHRHAIDVAGITFADEAPAGATGIGGMLFDLAAATALKVAPVWLAAAATLLALAGWSVWRSPLAPRLLAVALAFLTVAAASPTGNGAVLLAAPLALAGLVFLPDGLRDLARAALDRRRIVVRRVTR